MEDRGRDLIRAFVLLFDNVSCRCCIHALETMTSVIGGATPLGQQTRRWSAWPVAAGGRDHQTAVAVPVERRVQRLADSILQWTGRQLSWQSEGDPCPCLETRDAPVWFLVWCPEQHVRLDCCPCARQVSD